MRADAIRQRYTGATLVNRRALRCRYTNARTARIGNRSEQPVIYRRCERRLNGREFRNSQANAAHLTLLAITWFIRCNGALGGYLEIGSHSEDFQNSSKIITVKKGEQRSRQTALSTLFFLFLVTRYTAYTQKHCKIYVRFNGS